MSHSLFTTLRIAAIAACIGVVAPPLMAQSTSGPPSGPPSDSMQGHHGRHDPGAMLFKGITLSSTQKAQIDSIHGHYRASMDSLRQSGNKDWSGMRKIRESETADIRNVLTSDQQTIFDQNLNTMKQHMQERRAQNPGAPPAN